MKRIFTLFLASLCMMLGLSVFGCGKETIVIYTSVEDYCMELMQERLDEKFPEYNIVVEYISTSNIASRVIEEKSSSECDIIYGLEYAYLEKLVASDALANLNDKYDINIFHEDMIIDTIKSHIVPCERAGGAIIVNKDLLEEKNLAMPTCYEDLLDPSYKGLVSMPSPKSSSTGYMFLLSLVNEWGEDEAFDYFEKLSENIYNDFTGSGSGPVNNLKNREAVIGLGLLTQAVQTDANIDDDFEVLFFEEGAPYGAYGNAIVTGKETKTSVMEIMDYLYSDFIAESAEKFFPEKLYKDKDFNVEGYPTNIKYSDMSNNTSERKEELLARWSF